MDTDDLSNETYEAILITSEKFNHDLTLQFGLLADLCKDDDNYLKKAKLLIKKWKSNLRGSITNIFFDSKPATLSFEKVLLDIKDNIQDVVKIPIEKRTFDF